MSEVRRDAPEDELADDTKLWRRVGPKLVNRAGDKVEPMSGAFLAPNDQLSLHRASETDVDTVRAAYPGIGIIEITAGELRSIAGLSVVPDPLDEDASHALAKGKVSRPKAKKLRAAATWVIEPEMD